MGDFITVAAVGEIPAGGMKAVSAGGESVIVVEQDGEYFALQDRCSHEEFPLSEGELEDGEITCILHGARFDVRSGTPKSLPAILPVKKYDVRVEGDEIQVRV
jgi:3-phenylpropionate/trans-cinnamate dioxygenase ferredoxin subunit